MTEEKCISMNTFESQEERRYDVLIYIFIEDF